MRWLSGILLLAALLLLLTGVIDYFRLQHPSLQRSPVQEASPYWVFLSDDGWEGSGLPSALEALSGRMRVRSEWLQAVSVEIPRNRYAELASLPGVVTVRPVRRLRGPIDVPGGNGDGLPESSTALVDTIYGDLGVALETLAVPAAHDLGFRGVGTRVGILGGFFWSNHVSLRSNPPISVRDFVDGDDSVEPGPSDSQEEASSGTGLWSLIGGDWRGSLTGVAPGAGVLLARVVSDDDGVGADEDRWVAGLEWLETQGARVVLSGVGFRNFEGGIYGPGDLNGDLPPATKAADEAARRGVLVVAPTGNGGPGPETLQSPADGDSVMAVGAVNSLGEPSVFSAEGPTADGRSKPDLRAPGESIPAASALGEETLSLVQGTEYSAALLAGAAAVFVEAYPERGPMGILEALAKSATQSTGIGFLVPQLAPAVVFPGGVLALPLEDVTPEGRVTSLAPQLQWNVPTTHPLGLPVSFHLEFAPDSLFQDVVLRDSVVGTFARRLQAPLPPRTDLYWRVVASSQQGIRWATPRQGPLEVPSWVSLGVLNDPGGTQVADPQPEFLWTAMDLPGPGGPFTFELQVISDRDGEVIQSHGGLVDERHQLEDPLPFNVPLRWQIIAEARNGAADTVASAGPFVVTGGANPPITILYQNFPNPFPNPDEGIWETRVWFDLAQESRVELAVYDMRGRLVRNLIPGPGCGPTILPPGLYGRDQDGDPGACAAFTWDARDDRGQTVSPGVYLLRLRAGGVVEVRRVVYWP